LEEVVLDIYTRYRTGRVYFNRSSGYRQTCRMKQRNTISVCKLYSSF